MKKSKLGPTGRFPKGKINKDDEGELQLAVFSKNGRVFIEFGCAVKWLGMDPNGAIAIGKALIEKAKSLLN